MCHAVADPDKLIVGNAKSIVVRYGLDDVPALM